MRGTVLDRLEGTTDRAGIASTHLVGVVSDTHDLIRPGLLEALAECDLIVHAGDIASAKALSTLEAVAPLFAVRGNMDFGPWTQGLRRTEFLEVGDVSLYVIHDLDKLDLDPAAAGLDAVISGHTHRPAIHRRNGVLYINPGSAGASRNDLPASVAVLQVEGNQLATRLVSFSG